ncbi:MAG: carbon monoxide dehydrogenase subunit G [bacterium]|nr:carbon monoxide dehydrogenase subunit G [bacterium]
MTISGSHSVAAERERLYALLQDPEVLARCLPGCQGLERVGTDEYRMKMKAALGSVSGLFDGKVQITDQAPPDSFRMSVEGYGKIGFLKGDGVLRLCGDGAATEVAYDGEVQVGGVIAAVGQRLIGTTAKVMIKKFFARLEAEVRP